MRRRSLILLAALSGLLAAPALSVAETGTVAIAAAADLKFAMDEIAAAFRDGHPGVELQVTYGSSGKFHAQIRQGAPFDLFFSADIAYPRELAKDGLAGSEVVPYAIGRIVIWSGGPDAARMALKDLAGPRIGRIAIANPKHAPYGKRAEEALRASGLWNAVQPKLVFGENVSQAAQFVRSGNAQAGIVALSLALNPELAGRGGYSLIPETLHAPLEQGYVVTRRGAGKPAVEAFAAFMDSGRARGILTRYGFEAPGARAGR